MTAEGIVEQAKLFTGKVQKGLGVHAIMKTGSMTFWTDKFRLSNQSETTTQNHVISLIDQEIKRACPSFSGISIETSPPSPVGPLDFTLYFLDSAWNSMVKKAAEDVKNDQSIPERFRKNAEQTIDSIESISPGATDVAGRAYVYYDAQRIYKHRLSEVYLTHFQYLDDWENRAIGLARVGAHELAHQITELFAKIDGKKGLDPAPQETGLGGSGPIKFPHGRHLPNRLIAKMKESIQNYRKI